MRMSVVLTFLLVLSPLASYSESRWVISYDGLRMRQTPDFNAARIVVIPYGEEVEVIPGNGDPHWVQAEWNGKTGWVYGDYLTDSPVEPKSSIVKLENPASFLTGMWYPIRPFSLQEAKLQGGYRMIDSVVEFKSDGTYRNTNYEGGRDGRWSLRGNVLTVKGTDLFAGEPPSHFAQSGEIAVYRIGSEWLVLETAMWEDSPRGPVLSVSFVGRPLTDQGLGRVRHWSWTWEEVTGH